MAIVNEIFRVENDNTISFGNHESAAKLKIDFEHNGNAYYVKTYKEATRVELNGNLLFETVPGSTIHNFYFHDDMLEFEGEGAGNTQFTITLEPNTTYNITADGTIVGTAKSNMAGKINFGKELTSDPFHFAVTKA